MEQVQLKSLADFRRFLAKPGATVQVIKNDWANKPFFGGKPDYWDPRTVGKLQTNGVMFKVQSTGQGTWLMWDRRGAKSFRFDGSDLVTIDLGDDSKFDEVFQYKCWIAA